MLKNLGQRIRQLRKTKSITLIEVSKLTGIAQATLSRIETGVMMGTVECHEKIAEVLGIGLAELYSGVDRRYEEIAHTKTAERKISHLGRNVQIEVLTQESSNKKITPLLITLQGESRCQEERNERGIEKFLYLIEGEIKVKLDKSEYILKTGETLYFDASLTHQIINEKNKTAKMLIAVSPSKI